jgi:cell fate (sporulation/competence/biofilm development) regulator YlbF (YheA/YmcA/DUF963 family)
MLIIDPTNDTRKPSLDSKIQELCQAILDDLRVQSAREQVEAFLEDDDARELYSAVAQKGEELHQKQHQGEELTEADVKMFEKLRSTAFSDPRVQQFSSARAALQEVEDRIVAYVEKTLELGRIPNESEVVRQGGCCGGGGGGGCGCN